MYVSIMNNSYTDLGGLGNTRSTPHFFYFLFIYLATLGLHCGMQVL